MAALKDDESLYVRRSLGNVLRGISKKHPDLVQNEIHAWSVADKEVSQVYESAAKFFIKDK